MWNNHEIIFIAEHVENFNNATIQSTNLEFANGTYFDSLYSTLNKISNNELIYYNNLEDFINNINKHKHPIVLSVWSGENSRNRKGLVQAICESYNVPYVGADSYFQLICSDKHLSKKLANDFSIDTPSGYIIRSSRDYILLKLLQYPIVIKPNQEGGSIGIYSDNLIYTYDEAISLCDKLLLSFSPLIAEEYCIGEEYSICIAGVNQKIDVFEVIRLGIDGNYYFHNAILGAEIKKQHLSKRTKECITDIFPKEIKDKLCSFYNAMGKIEVMRIDGRYDNQKFTLLEFTPDCSLNIAGSVSMAFEHAGYDYEGMLKLLLSNALKSWELENANRL